MLKCMGNPIDGVTIIYQFCDYPSNKIPYIESLLFYCKDKLFCQGGKHLSEKAAKPDGIDLGEAGVGDDGGVAGKDGADFRIDGKWRRSVILRQSFAVNIALQQRELPIVRLRSAP